MQLTHLTIERFGTVSDRIDFDLCDGLNIITGPNNCGKEQILKAIALLMDHHTTSTDLWRVGATPGGEPTTVIGTFLAGGNSPGTEIRLRVSTGLDGLGPTVALELGDGSSLSGAVARAWVDQRLKALLVPAAAPTTETLPELMTELYEARLEQDVDPTMVAALERAFSQGLATELLGGVEEDSLSLIRNVLPEVAAISIRPAVESAATAIRDARIDAHDAGGWRIEERGSGLRVLATLGIIRRLVIHHHHRAYLVVIEEPEAYLHPEAQGRLRKCLEELGRHPAATLIVTTESPFLISTDEASKTFLVNRDHEHGTTLAGEASGDENPFTLAQQLVGRRHSVEGLQRAAGLESAEAILVVEGYTDAMYVRHAAEVLGRSEELEHVLIVAAEGAEDAALRAVVTRAESQVPLLVVLDDDEMGDIARATLRDRFGFRSSEQLLMYSEVVDGAGPETEAEDLFSSDLLDRYVSVTGESAIAAKTRTRDGTGWRYDFSKEFKSELAQWLVENATTPQHIDGWIRLLDEVTTRLERQRERRARAEARREAAAD